MTLTSNVDAVLVEQGVASSKSTRDWSMLRLQQVANLVLFLANPIVGIIVVSMRRGQVDNERPPQPLFFLLPATYAFGIWFVIYAGEFVFALWQVVQKPGFASERRLLAIQAVSPWWCAAHAFTIMWMFSRLTWLSAILLTLVAICLCVAHGVLAGEKESPDFWVMTAPITLHFGWGTAAALVTWNLFVAESTTSVSTNLFTVAMSLAVAAGLGGTLTLNRRTPLLAYTVAWAIIAVGVMTLFPNTAERLAKYDGDLGQIGRYVLGSMELVLGLGLVGLGLRVQTQQEA